MLLTEHDINLNHVVRSERDGQTPAVVFDIVNRENVDAMIAENTARNIPERERLRYTINEEENTLSISIFSTGRRNPYAMTYQLALSILSLVLSSHENDGVRPDLHAFALNHITEERIQKTRAQYWSSPLKNVPPSRH